MHRICDCRRGVDDEKAFYAVRNGSVDLQYILHSGSISSQGNRIYVRLVGNSALQYSNSFLSLTRSNQGIEAAPCHRDTRFRYQFILSVAMDQFFTPTRRYQDLFGVGMDDDLGPFEYTEIELAVPVEEFLVCNLDWKYLWAFLTGAGVTKKILWITEDVFLVVDDDENDFHFHDDAPGSFLKADFQGTSGQEQTLILACNDFSIGVANVFWRAITTSNSIQVTI
jgi:hypothetical protein